MPVSAELRTVVSDFVNFNAIAGSKVTRNDALSLMMSPDNLISARRMRNVNFVLRGPPPEFHWRSDQPCKSAPTWSHPSLPIASLLGKAGAGVGGAVRFETSGATAPGATAGRSGSGAGGGS